MLLSDFDLTPKKSKKCSPKHLISLIIRFLIPLFLIRFPLIKKDDFEKKSRRRQSLHRFPFGEKGFNL